MSGHINIHQPNDEHWRHLTEMAKLRAELDAANRRADQYASDLRAIFSRLEAGQEVELWLDYPRRAMVVRQWEPLGTGWPAKVGIS